MTPTSNTRGQKAAADIGALLRARNPLIWIVTREEARAEGLLFVAAASANYTAYTWDCAQGAKDFSGANVLPDSTDPGACLAGIERLARQGRNRAVWIMRDLPPWLAGPIGMATTRQLRNLARFLPGVERDRAQAIVILSPSAQIPDELAGHATVVDWPLPDREEIAAILDAAIASLPDGLRDQAATNGTRDAAIDAAVGLTGEEAASCYARSLVQSKKIDPATVSAEKRRVVSRERVLEWYDPIPGGLASVGGLDNLKTWLTSRKSAYSAAARQYGLPAPKGMMLVGVPGCGKSLTAKAVATAWACPLLKIDLGALKSKFVGDSEANLRKAFAIIAAIGRCVVWFDEIEKALAGSTQGAADGGVISDALGAILSWMQERQGEAFVIATANDVTGLPPELLRKGRFDELWFVDLPNEEERAEILRASLRSHGRMLQDSALLEISAATADFTGAEIAALVPDALYAAFADNARDLRAADLTAASKTVVPLAETAKDKIAALRQWAKGRARPATNPTTATATSARVLDI